MQRCHYANLIVCRKSIYLCTFYTLLQYNVNLPNYQNILHQVASLITFLYAVLTILHLNESSHLLSKVSKWSGILWIMGFFFTQIHKNKIGMVELA